jgi:hypothetical protein
MVKRFLLKFSFLIVLVGTTIILIGNQDNNLYKKKTIDDNIARVKGSFYEDSLDILFMGDSRTIAGVDPKIFDSAGYRSYNLAIASGGPYFTKIIWDDYRKFHKKLPKALVINISPQIFASGISDVFEKYPIYRYLHQPLLADESLLVDFNIGIPAYITLKYNRCLTGFFQLRSRPDTENVNKAISKALSCKGFDPFTGEVTDSIAKADSIVRYSETRAASFEIKKEESFLNFIKTVSLLGVKVILHQPPSKDAHYYSDDYLNAYKAFVKKLQQMKEVILIPNTEEYPDALFYDMVHLNINGANKYTHRLLNYFINNKIIENK